MMFRVPRLSRSCRQRALALCICAFGPGAVGAEPARPAPVLLPEAEQAQWNAVGRVNIAGYNRRQMCTGTLISPDTVLTAAHCVLGPTGRPAAPDSVIFGAGWRGGIPAASAEGARVTIHPAFLERLTGGGIDIEHDLALIHLSEPLAAIAPLPVAPLPVSPAPESADAPLAILGYRADRPHIATRLAPCQTLRRSASALLTDCRVIAGTSGAPVLAETAAGWHVTAIVSALTPAGTVAALPGNWDALP